MDKTEKKNKKSKKDKTNKDNSVYKDCMLRKCHTCKKEVECFKYIK